MSLVRRPLDTTIAFALPPGEDTRDGFQHGGWAQQATDPAVGAAIGERMGRDFSWLFGQRSYEECWATGTKPEGRSRTA